MNLGLGHIRNRLKIEQNGRTPRDPKPRPGQASEAHHHVSRSCGDQSDRAGTTAPALENH